MKRQEFNQFLINKGLNPNTIQYKQIMDALDRAEIATRNYVPLCFGDLYGKFAAVMSSVIFNLFGFHPFTIAVGTAFFYFVGDQIAQSNYNNEGKEIIVEGVIEGISQGLTPLPVESYVAAINGAANAMAQLTRAGNLLHLQSLGGTFAGSYLSAYFNVGSFMTIVTTAGGSFLASRYGLYSFWKSSLNPSTSLIKNIIVSIARKLGLEAVGNMLVAVSTPDHSSVQDKVQMSVLRGMIDQQERGAIQSPVL